MAREARSRTTGFLWLVDSEEASAFGPAQRQGTVQMEAVTSAWQAVLSQLPQNATLPASDQMSPGHRLCEPKVTIRLAGGTACEGD